MIKEYLRNKGVNVDRFCSDNTPRIRRKRKRGLGGEVSIPVNPAISEINDIISPNGEYELGELITPREFKKIKLTSNGFSTETEVIQGRKIPVMRIRQKLLDEHERLGLLRAHSNYDSIPIENISTLLKYLGEYSDDLNEKEQRQKLKEIETTRYLTCWADHSTIAGHTYVLYTFSCLYDEAVFVANFLDLLSFASRTFLGFGNLECLRAVVCASVLINSFTTISFQAVGLFCPLLYFKT